MGDNSHAEIMSAINCMTIVELFHAIEYPELMKARLSQLIGCLTAGDLEVELLQGLDPSVCEFSVEESRAKINYSLIYHFNDMAAELDSPFVVRPIRTIVEVIDQEFKSAWDCSEVRPIIEAEIARLTADINQLATSTCAALIGIETADFDWLVANYPETREWHHKLVNILELEQSEIPVCFSLPSVSELIKKIDSMAYDLSDYVAIFN